MVLLAMALGGTAVQAMPSGGDIRSGQGSISQDGKNMTVLQNSDRMAIDWTKFDIAKDETVRYAQPDRNAISLNRVTGGQQSVIAGNLNANGNVVLVNPNGVVFTKNSSVDVGGLVASTARLNDEAMKNFDNGKASLGLSLDKDSTAAVINEGQIKAQGGLVALHAANVENKGTITDEGGTLAMAAAKNLTLSAADDDKLNFTVDGDLAKAQALNSGSLKADGGYVVMTAKSAGDVLSTVVNNSGTIEAKTLRKNEKGQILLDGGDNGQVEVSGTLDASSTEEGQDAGNIKVIGQKTVVHDNTNLLAKGDNNGGKIETSGDVLDLGDNLNIDAVGVNGKHGEWLLDPLEVLIQDEQPIQSNMDRTEKTVNGGSETQITYNDPPSATANADSTYASTSWIKTILITDILKNGTDVTIQAASTSQAASITVNSAITPIIGGDGEATLELDAQRNITINKAIKADSSGGKLNVKLNSDTDGDGVGAVIINADISTNGGTFTSGSGGNVVYDATVKDANGKTVYQKDSSGKYVTNSQTGEKVPEYKTAGYITDGVLSGNPKINGHTVGTYFGYATPTDGSTVIGTKADRKVSTNGGDINLYGEVAIGLNGGTLSLDTSKTDGNKGGDLNITGIINSGNSYDDYIYGTKAWDKLVSSLVNKYLEAGTVPAYHFVGINYKDNGDGTYTISYKPTDYAAGVAHYAFRKLLKGDTASAKWTITTTENTLDTQDTRWYVTASNAKAGMGFNSFIMEATTPETSKMTIDDWLIYYRRTEPGNYAARYAGGDSSKVVTYADIKADTDTTRMDNLKSDISALIAHNWFASETLAKSGTGANAGNSYLATITTALENSLSTPNSQKTLWVGGMGSGVRNKTNDPIRIFTHTPADPTHPDGFYWVTGPEGLVTNSLTYTKSDGTIVSVQGIKFWDTSDSDYTNNDYGRQVYGYTKWSSWSGGGQPDNSAPFLTVGYGNNNAWDDASVGGETTVGFVQETNLYNSSLNVKTGGGSVTLQGDIGKSVGLDTVKIDAGSGSVITGNTKNTATKYNNGTIYADHGVYINGGEVTVGGEIHSGGSNIEATRNTTWTETDADKMDNVTINASGNLTVHGIESNGYTTSTTAGGKIKLTSTSTDGVITLGDGVDYNGTNANGGVLKAANTAQGAVVIDAQGSNGGFVNKTSAEKAIDTSGTWQIYSASPDKDTFGTHLNSGTDAQWTSKSASNTIATENKYGKNPNGYSDISSNKFIFQATPVITLYSEDYLKTYGDEVSADTLNKLLKGKEVFTGLDGKKHNVTDYSFAFQEKDYTEYISGEDAVTITSDGAAFSATRTGGKYEATEKSGADGKNAVYDLTVNLNDAKALDGYAIDTENGKLEIKKRTASITGTGAQTYGDTDKAIKNWTDTKKNIADGSTVSYTTSIKAGSEYTKNQNRRNTADADTYNDSVSFDNLKITDSKGNEVSIADNYDLTTTGAITVGKAKLIVNTDGKTTTYGTVDESYTSKLDDSTKALNGDDADKLISDLGLTYKTDAYQDSDGDGKYDRTNHVKYTSDGKNYDSYTLDVANTNTLKNYEVTVNDSTVTLERATATVDTDKVTTDYGKVDTSYTSHFKDALNGDKEEDLLKQLNLSYSTDAYKDADHTNDVKEGGYDLKVQANGSLTYDDYDVTVNPSNVTLNKVNLMVNPEDIHQIYGQAKEVQEDAKTAYNLSGFANGDTKDTVDKDGKTVDQLVKVTNDVSNALKDDGTHTQNASTDGYDMGTTASGNLTNYNIGVGEQKKVYLDKAKLTVSVNDTSTTYGQNQWTPYTYTLAGNTNGDTVDTVKNNQISVTYTNGGEKSDTSNDAVKTQNAGKYDLIGNFTLSGDTATNYEIDTVNSNLTGTAEVKKADLTLTLKDVSTTYGQEFDPNNYGYKKDAADLQGLTNGDSAAAITDVLQDSDFTYVNGGAKSDPNNENVKTQNAGNYQITGSTSKTLDNYNIKVVNPGTSTVGKAKLTLTVGDTKTTYGSDAWTPYAYTLQGNTNGDTVDGVKNNQISVTYTNGGEKSDASNKDVKTQDVGSYDLTGEFTLSGDTAVNYEIDKVNSKLTGTAKVNQAEIHLKLNDVSTTYGTAFDTSKYGYDASQLVMTNGDDVSVVTGAITNKDINYTNTGDADPADKAKGAVTKNAGTGYQLTGTTEKTLKNYTVKIDGADASIDKATLKLKVGDYTEAYGAADKVGTDLKQTEVTGEQNGDDLADLVSEIGIHNTSKALLSDTRTNDVKYKADGSLDSYQIDTQLDKDTLKNYNLELSEGTMTLTPVDITVDNEMIQTYGSQDKSFKEVTDPALPNGDKISTDSLKMAPKANGKYETNKGNRTTADAGTYKDDLAFSGGGIVHEDGTTEASKNYNVTIKGDIIVNKAPLYVNTDDILTYYGIVKNTQSNVSGLTNGDKADGIQYGYGDYGHGYLNGNTTTNMPGNYAFGTALSGPDFLKNYNIIGGNANLQIIQSKPDQTTHYVEGAHRPQDKIESALPVFRVDAEGLVKQYGTYGIENKNQAVTLSPTGMRMPEPNQTSTQDRKYMTSLKTPDGQGTFRLEYNGVVLRVIPVDPAAEQIVEAGDKLKNVALSEQALHVAYTQMGLDLVNLKGVYIYMAPMSV